MIKINKKIIANIFFISIGFIITYLLTGRLHIGIRIIGLITFVVLYYFFSKNKKIRSRTKKIKEKITKRLFKNSNK